MPKVNLFTPQKQLEIEQDLRDRYGSTMSAKQVSEALGVKDYRIYHAWLKDVPSIKIGKPSKYRVQDVAAKMYSCMTL